MMQKCPLGEGLNQAEHELVSKTVLYRHAAGGCLSCSIIRDGIGGLLKSSIDFDCIQVTYQPLAYGEASQYHGKRLLADCFKTDGNGHYHLQYSAEFYTHEGTCLSTQFILRHVVSTI